MDNGRKRPGSDGDVVETHAPFTPGYRRPLGLHNQKLELEVLWTKVKSFLEDTFMQSRLSQSRLMELCSQVYEFDTAPPDAKESRMGICQSARETLNIQLYKRLAQLMQKYVITISNKAKDIPEKQCLTFYSEERQRYDLGCRAASLIFHRLNEKWAKDQRKGGEKNIFDLYDISQILWKTFVFPVCGIKVWKSLLVEIDNDRNGETSAATKKSFKNVVKSFIDMGIDEAKYEDDVSTDPAFCKRREAKKLMLYKTVFETQFLKQTSLYYKKEIAQLVKLVDDNYITLQEFLENIDSRFQLEESRGVEYLHPSTLPELIRTCSTIMVMDNLEMIMKACDTVLGGDTNKNIGIFRRLMVRAGPDSETIFAASLEKTIVDRGLTSIQLFMNSPQRQTQSIHVTFTELVLKEYAEREDLVMNTLEGNNLYMKALQQAFKTILNTNPNAANTGPMLAKYADILIANQKMTEEDRRDSLNKLFALSNLLESQDYFVKYYKIYLSNRLLYSRSMNEDLWDLEQAMVAKLPSEDERSSKTMFNDINLSKTLNEEFKKTDNGGHKPSYGLTVTVLTKEAWSNCNKEVEIDWNVPEEITVETTRYQTFYATRQKGRNLLWLWNNSRGEINYTLWDNNDKPRSKLLKLTFEQFLVLSAFSEVDTLTVGELIAGTQLTPQDFNEIMVWLGPKCHNILLFEKSIEEFTTTVTINKTWAPKKKVITLERPLKSHSMKQIVKGEESVEKGRTEFITAVIVRIMKTSKTCGHNDLVTQVINQVKHKFSPTIPDIKTAIEKLKVAEYIKLKDETIDEYVYMA